MTMATTTATAFLVRDFRIAWSYRFSFMFQNASLLFSLVSVRFVSNLLNDASPAALAEYGGDYFSFVILGLAINLLAYPLAKSFSGAVRSAQVTGTFEAELTTRTSGLAVVLCSGIYPVMIAFVRMAAMVVLSVALFGAAFQLADAPIVALALGLTVCMLIGIGLFAAAFVIAFRQNEPFTSGFIAVSVLISGILYPTSVLPGWLEALAPLLPITHAVELMRAYLLEGASTSGMFVHLAALSGFALLLPAGIVTLSCALRYARRTGSLSQY